MSFMNSDHLRNLEVAIRANVESLYSAWSYFHLLQGMHEGSKGNPAVVKRFDRFFDQTWRAIFDGFFAKVGTLIDNTKGAQSLPQIVTLCQRYGDHELKAVAKRVRAGLESPLGPIAKFESWRHKVVAHRTAEGYGASFRASNKMDLKEVSSGLSQLEELLNELSVAATRVHNDTETGSNDLVKEGRELFSVIAKQLADGNQ